MSNKTNKHVISKMEKEMMAKLRLVEKLSEKNSALRLKDHLLTAFCDSLHYLLQQSAFTNGIANASELLLLEQLGDVPYSCRPGTAVNEKQATATAAANSPAVGSQSAALLWPPSASSADALLLDKDKQAASLQTASSASCSAVAASNSSVRAVDTATADDPAGTACSKADAADAAGPVADDGLQTVAPDGDPLYLFKLCFSKATTPADVDDLQQELIAAAAQMVKDMSYNLHLHESGNYKLLCGPNHPAAQQPAQQIKAAFLKYHTLMASMALVQRENVAAQMTLLSHDGSRLVLKGEHGEAMYQRVVRQLDLSSQQLQIITQGLVILQDLRSPVIQQMRQLQQEFASQDDAGQPEGFASSNGTDSSTSSPGAVYGAVHGNHSSLYNHLGRNNQQEENLTKLRAALSKDVLIVAAMKAFAFGCMTWPQVAKTFVLFSPFMPGVVPFAAALSEYQREQQQQQQQQQLDQQQ